LKLIKTHLTQQKTKIKDADGIAAAAAYAKHVK
jgi:hypothetical protein